MEIKETDIHNHLKIRMLQRGITFEEIKRTIKDGKIILLTAIARYGKDFNKGGKTNEN
jgi:hypothetical protein